MKWPQLAGPAAEGLASFNAATMELLLGADSPAIREKRVAVLQAGCAWGRRPLHAQPGIHESGWTHAGCLPLASGLTARI